MDKDTVCDRFFGLYILFVADLWTKMQFAADFLDFNTVFSKFMDKDTVCIRFYGQRYCLRQNLWTLKMFVAESMDFNTVIGRIYGL